MKKLLSTIFLACLVFATGQPAAISGTTSLVKTPSSSQDVAVLKAIKLDPELEVDFLKKIDAMQDRLDKLSLEIEELEVIGNFKK